MGVRTLLIDNYDSYTYNLYQILAEVNEDPPVVVHNDEVDLPWVLQQVSAGRFHNIVVSPGPGSPAVAADIGLCLSLLRAAPPIPILGVCLGFQALALAHGGSVAHAPEPVHGRLSAVRHAGHALFAGIPSGTAYQVVRYHSLVVEEQSLPACLQPLAWTCGGHHALQQPKGSACEPGLAAAASPAQAGVDASGNGDVGVLMALVHRSLPHFGVQYHPESVATQFGTALVQNFRDITLAHHALPPMPVAGNAVGPPGRCVAALAWEQEEGNLVVQHLELPGVLHCTAGGAETLFTGVVLASNEAGAAVNGAEQAALFGGDGDSSNSSSSFEDTFWLDSSATDRGRFSFMGGRGGPLWRRVTYQLPSLEQRAAARGQLVPGTLTTTTAEGKQTEAAAMFWDWLAEELRLWQCRVDAATAAALPFNFWGGFVGYLGYELKAESGGRAGHQAETPDAAVLLADRLLALDHHTGSVYLVAMHEADSAGAADAAAAWIAATAEAVRRLAQSRPPANGNGHAGAATDAPAAQPSPLPPFQLREGQEQYLSNVAACVKALYDGESYELCLTTVLSRAPAPDPWALYRALRLINPVPYAAWLRFGGGGPAVCCSSPERFLRGDRGGRLEARPIKGTAPRLAGSDPQADAAAAAALSSSEKDRAENLMIVDLLRNDLGRVCDPGSVHVPALMQVESFSTVHQLVSTVRGQRCAATSAVEAIRAAFPGGSMTGAPKVRTMEILDALEGGPRGVYSGSLGYISFNDTFDLNIVIRTAVVHDGRVVVGAGGAIVVQSQPVEEYEEMRLKADAVLRAVGECEGRTVRVAGDQ